jgi:hypothetical protein
MEFTKKNMGLDLSEKIRIAHCLNWKTEPKVAYLIICRT